MRRAWALLGGLLLVLAVCGRGPAAVGPRTRLWAPAPDQVHPLGHGAQLEVVAEFPRPVDAGKVFFYVAWQGPDGGGRAPLRALDAGETQRGVGRWPPRGLVLPPGDYQLWAVAYRGREEHPSERARVVLLPAPATATPTSTPTPTARPATAPRPTPTPSATLPPDAVCYRAAFLADVTVPDGSPVPVGEPFVKIWRLKNAGACVWGPGTRVVREHDDGLHAPEDWLLPNAPILPGETVEVQVTLQAARPGLLQAAFRLQAVDGTRFGIGPEDGPFWVQVEAVEPTATPTPGPSPTAAANNGDSDAAVQP